MWNHIWSIWLEVIAYKRSLRFPNIVRVLQPRHRNKLPRWLVELFSMDFAKAVNIVYGGLSYSTCCTWKLLISGHLRMVYHSNIAFEKILALFYWLSYSAVANVTGACKSSPACLMISQTYSSLVRACKFALILWPFRAQGFCFTVVILVTVLYSLGFG